MSKTGFIYKVYDNTNGDVYYGSTTQKLCNRMTNHRCSYNRYKKDLRRYVTIFKILENNDYNYSVVEKVSFEEQYELHQRERFFIENNVCVNKVIPTRTNAEYREATTEKRSIQGKQYRDAHKDEINTRQSAYRAANKDKINQKAREKVTCECGCQVSKNSLTRHKKSPKHIKLMEEKNKLPIQ